LGFGSIARAIMLQPTGKGQHLVGSGGTRDRLGSRACGDHRSIGRARRMAADRLARAGMPRHFGTIVSMSPNSSMKSAGALARGWPELLELGRRPAGRSG